MVSNLVEKCSQFMWKDLIPENVCRALEFANLYEDATLKVRIYLYTHLTLLLDCPINFSSTGAKLELDPVSHPRIPLSPRI